MRSAFAFWSRLFIVLLLVGILFVYAMFQGGFVSWFLFYVFLPVAASTLYVAFYPLKSIKLDRRLKRTHASAGEQLSVELHIRLPIPLPFAFLLVEDLAPSTVTKTRILAKKLYFPLLRREWLMTYQLDSIQRGEHLFSGVRVGLGDFLGFMKKEKRFSLLDTVLVYPSYETITLPVFPSRVEQGVTSSSLKLERDTSMVVGIREYKSGDRFSWIDWKATARRGEVMAKEFDQMHSEKMLLLLDRTNSQSFESAISFIASWVKASEKAHIPVGLLSVGKERVWIRPQPGKEGVQSIFYHLARTLPDGEIELGTLLQAKWEGLESNDTTMVVTGKVTTSLVQALEKHSQQKRIILVLVQDQENGEQHYDSSLFAKLPLSSVSFLRIKGGAFAETLKRREG